MDCWRRSSAGRPFKVLCRRVVNYEGAASPADRAPIGSGTSRLEAAVVGAVGGRPAADAAVIGAPALERELRTARCRNQMKKCRFGVKKCIAHFFRQRVKLFKQ